MIYRGTISTLSSDHFQLSIRSLKKRRGESLLPFILQGCLAVSMGGFSPLEALILFILLLVCIGSRRQGFIFHFLLFFFGLIKEDFAYVGKIVCGPLLMLENLCDPHNGRALGWARVTQQFSLLI